MQLSNETIKTIKATAPILEVHGATITTVFYKNMFINHPELLNMFNEVNQKQGKQQQALANLVYEAAKNIEDRKSTRLNSSHVATSYAVFCLTKKTKTTSS